MAESPHCSPETITLLINYIPIKIRSLKLILKEKSFGKKIDLEIKYLLTVNKKVYLQILNSVALIRMPVLRPVPYFPNYCCFIKSFEIGGLSSQTEFLFYKKKFAYVVPSYSHINFKITLSISTKRGFLVI